MNIDLTNNLMHGENVNKIICDFIKSIQEKIDKGDKNFSMDNDSKLITIFRDKMNVEKMNILNAYAKENINKGDMYYIYSKSSKSDQIYNLCICDEKRSHEVIELNVCNLPVDARIGDVLYKNKNDEYIIDIDASENIDIKLEELKEQILKEQSEYLQNKRIEGHIYEVSDKQADRVFLFDNSEDNGIQEEIEEIEFPKELLESVNIGDLYKYENGIYNKI